MVSKCRYCTHSIGTDKADMLCAEINDLVHPDDVCELYMREPGADDCEVANASS
jgi:hypothetical protein